MELLTIGIDLGKTVFHLVGLNLRGEVVVRKKFSRKQLLHFTSNLQVRVVGHPSITGCVRVARQNEAARAADAAREKPRVPRPLRCV